MGSPRSDILKRMVALAKPLRGATYLVHRGPINWAGWDFDRHPRAIAIMHDEGSLLGNAAGMRTGNFAVEIFARNPRKSDSVPPEIDDDLFDQLHDDASWIVRQLEKSQNSEGDSVVFRIDAAGARVLESHDAELGVQGVVATFTAIY